MGAVAVFRRRTNRLKSDLCKIPGIGVDIEPSLVQLGFRTISSLKNADADRIYEKECLTRGRRIDRCLLYKYRCAVYYASTEHPDPEKLKWLYWQDEGKKS